MAIALFAAAAVLFAVADDFYLRWQIEKYKKEEAGTARTAQETEAAGEAADTDEAARETAGKAPDAPAAASEPDDDASWLKRRRIIAAVLAVPAAVLLAAVSHMYYGNSAEYALKLMCIFELLIPVGILDKRFNKIPNKVVLAGLVLFIGFFLFELFAMHEPFRLLVKEAFFGLLLGGGVFALCGIISRSGMGAGDIKLFAVLGLLMTWRGVFNMIFFSVLLIAVYGIFNLATKRMTKDSQIPMGPYVLTAMAIVILLGI